MYWMRNRGFGVVSRDIWCVFKRRFEWFIVLGWGEDENLAANAKICHFHLCWIRGTDTCLQDLPILNGVQPKCIFDAVVITVASWLPDTIPHRSLSLPWCEVLEEGWMKNSWPDSHIFLPQSVVFVSFSRATYGSYSMGWLECMDKKSYLFVTCSRRGRYHDICAIEWTKVEVGNYVASAEIM